MRRKTRFWWGLLVIVFVYVFPLASAIVLKSIWMLTVVSTFFLLSIYLLYRFTIKNVKPKYPLLSPEGHPDGYDDANIPRPLFEDMEQYPWLFKKKRKKPTAETKKVKKKH